MPVKPRQTKGTVRAKPVARKRRPVRAIAVRKKAASPESIASKPVGKGRDLTQESPLSEWMDWLKGTGDPLAKETLGDFRERLGLSRVELARGAGLSERTVATLEKSGHRKAPAGTRRKVEEFVRLCLALDEHGPEGGLGSWLRSPQEWLAGSTPLHAIEVGRMDWLWRLVYQLRSGEPM